MSKGEVHNYFEKGLAKGYSLEELKQKLISVGHDPIAVDKYAHSYIKKTLLPMDRKFYTFVVIIALITLAFFATLISYGNDKITAQVVADNSEQKYQDMAKIDSYESIIAKNEKNLIETVNQADIDDNEANKIANQVKILITSVEQERNTMKKYVVENTNSVDSGNK